jgi:cholinesterase
MTRHSLLAPAFGSALGFTVATSLLTGVVSLVGSAPVHAASFTGINTFGDSLADTGNLFALTSAFFPPGIPPVPPSPPYAQRLSNGPIWVDNLAQAFNLSPVLITDLILNPPAVPPTQGINFAFAGALSSRENLVDDDIPGLAALLPGFLEQVEVFGLLGLPVDPNALNIVAVGANDYVDALGDPAFLSGPALLDLPNQVTNNIVAGIGQLASLGANNFLVMNLPPLGETPFANTLTQQLGLPIDDTLNQLSFAHNIALEQKLANLSLALPGLKISTLEIDDIFAAAIANPQAFGLTNTQDACLTNFRAVFQFDGICNNPDEFLFWDDVHPTAATYKIVSDVALATIAPPPDPTDVPEPSLLLGLVAAGSALGLTQRKSKL